MDEALDATKRATEATPRRTEDFLPLCDPLTIFG